MSQGGSSRDPDVAAVRSTYAGYDASGRERLWDRSNRGFARLKGDSERTILELLRRSLPISGPTYLDLGCGDGSLIAMVLNRWPDVVATGIDLLADRVDAARRSAPGATFVVGSATELPVADGSVDVVSAITLFSSIPSREMEADVAREVRRVVRPGGWLVWYDLRYDNPSNPAVHGISRRRLAELFPGWSQELRSLTVAPPIARRLGRLTPVAYPILHAVPPLRSHLVGRLRCPG